MTITPSSAATRAFVAFDAAGNEYDREGNYDSHLPLGHGLFEVHTRGGSSYQLKVPDGGHFEIVPT